MSIRKRFVEKVTELVNVGAPNLWEHFKDLKALMACDDVCLKKLGRRSN